MQKQSLIALLETAFRDLSAAVDGLDEAALATPFYDGWSVKDILAHIAGWHRVTAAALDRISRGEHPSGGGPDYGDSEAWNAKFAAEAASMASAAVMRELRDSFEALIAAAQRLPEERFAEGRLARRALEGNGVGHYREHLPSILEYRSALERPA